jgi:ABC-2 type transport system permease protein
MTTLHVTAPPVTGPGAAARVAALARAEVRLLLRNRTAVVNSVLLPLLLVAVIPAFGWGGVTGVGPRMVVSALGVTLVFLTYYNLVVSFVARREELVLQRLRTGELTEGEIVLGTAVPTLVVTVAQVLLVAAGVGALGKWQAPVDVVLPLVALVGGAALMVVLAAASTSFTRTPETAQITTLPLVVVAMSLSGLFVPLSLLPEPLAQAARLLPVTPVLELAQLGLAGQAWDGAAVDLAGAWAAAPVPLAVLAGWLVVGTLVARRVFRWAPRR